MVVNMLFNMVDSSIRVSICLPIWTSFCSSCQYGYRFSLTADITYIYRDANMAANLVFIMYLLSIWSQYGYSFGLWVLLCIWIGYEFDAQYVFNLGRRSIWVHQYVFNLVI